ncbi:SPOR domain-containing protein [Ideonella sp. B7]|uniref:SPOR domain-containing protein n=1 Tax=Ideonella benzenivorans TaxID=2831643 RepID=UPI001CECDAAD|nr:SPOR domain-containing protein [Ideonella benzenivorans]MCA6216145.1 SPOR domain-containing protein [Ideonella benzenivorans]
MGLLSKFKIRRTDPSAAPRGGAVDPVEQVREARLKARRRLIGVTLLLVAGIIGFPLLFETQPRPIPVDIPIEIPSREAAAPLQAAAKPVPAPASAAVPAPTEPSPSEVPQEVVEPTVHPSAPPAPVVLPPAPVKAPMVAPETPPKKAEATAHKDKAAAEPKPADSKAPHAGKEAKDSKAKDAKGTDGKSADLKPVKDSKTTETKTAKDVKATDSKGAKTDSKPVPAKADAPSNAKTADVKTPDTQSDEGRFVVQIGAFAEANSARDARGKVELLGLSTYTQVIESASGRRIRVRVGPFATKADADKAAARIKSAGLQAAVLKL